MGVICAFAWEELKMKNGLYFVVASCFWPFLSRGRGEEILVPFHGSLN